MWDSELGEVDDVVARALREDLARGDVTSLAVIAADASGRAIVLAKGDLVVCGLPVMARVFAAVGVVDFAAERPEGERVAPGTVVARVRGGTRALLAAERTGLNFVQRMSGIATLTRSCVDATGGRCRITDTRKTTPGLRVLERYAVRCGGGHNHRDDLGSGVLIKDNHVRAAGGVGPAVAAAKRHAPHTLKIECEVTTAAELREALAAGADVVLLDNMDDAQIREAIALVQRRAIVEVSGGITLERIPRLAALGVDVISIGALTHSARAVDLSLELET